MAKAKMAAAPKRKAKKAAKAVAPKAKPASAKKGGKTKKAGGKSIDVLWKLAEHPLVAELIAIGATAAVAAVAEQSIAREGGKGKKRVPSNAAVKAAGTAAAAAIGQRLINEFSGAKKASKKASA